MKVEDSMQGPTRHETQRTDRGEAGIGGLAAQVGGRARRWALGGGAGLGCGAVLGTCGSLMIAAAGLEPETAWTVDVWAPWAGLFVASLVWVARGDGPRGGGASATLRGSVPVLGGSLVMWGAGWLWLVGRLNPAAWWAEGLREAGPELGAAAAGAVLAWLLGSLCGAVWRDNRMNGAGWAGTVCGAASALAWAGWGTGAGWPGWDQAGTTAGAHGVTVEHLGPGRFGTRGVVVRFDFGADPTMRLRVFDADGADATPWDDRCTVFHARPIERVAGAVGEQARAEGREALAVFNAAFFGWDRQRIAFHEQPIVVDGVARYRVDLMRPREQAWMLGVLRAGARDGAGRFELVQSVPFDALEARFETAVGGVRPLLVEGRALDLEPGIGGLALKTSRTSVAWRKGQDALDVLVVRDPDAEWASQLHRRNGWAPSGGWDIADVQKFWLARGMTDAALLDGGDSTQLAVRRGTNGERERGWAYVRGGHSFSPTIGYLNDRPVRLILPVMPAQNGRNGVLNYLFVDRAGTSDEPRAAMGNQ